MKIACLSFSESGKNLGDKLKEVNKETYKIDHYINKDLQGGIKGHMAYLWTNYDGLIFISSTGIAIRYINPYIKHKSIDPAIVLIDDLGNFSISLLSGHLGGANDLAEFLAKKIKAIPVITTASDNRGIEGLDLFAKENDYFIENKENLTKIMAMMVNGEKIGFYSEDNKTINYPYLKKLQLKDIIESPPSSVILTPPSPVILNKVRNLKALILVTSSTIDLSQLHIPHIILRPKNIYLGIGCRKAIEGDRIIRAIREALEGENLSANSIKAIGTVEVKKDEEGLIQAAKHYKCPLEIFTLEEISRVEDRFSKSQFVKDTIGVYSVAEPSAYLLGGKIIKGRQAFKGITIAIGKETRDE